MNMHLFVPYWRVSGSLALPEISQSSLHTLMYFAVHPQDNGSIDISDPGYAQIENFISRTKDLPGKKVLTLSMQDESISSVILENPDLHETLASNLTELTIRHGFDGIVLDLEYAALPTQSTISHISAFTKTLSESARKNNLSFSMAIYGDTYYRSRPYNIRTLAPLVDYIYIMAYDFHKSYGLPGPNFPLSTGANMYEYSLESALQDFSTDAHPDQLIPTYGLYGYDWSVDDQNRPAKQASAQTLNQIVAKYSPCTESSCTVSRDSISAETSISFSDSSGQKHTIWYEDITSLNLKIKKSRSFNIQSSAIWAAGYY